MSPLLTTCFQIFRKGNGTPLQYSCLEKSREWRSLVGYSPWGREESDMTERLHFQILIVTPGFSLSFYLQFLFKSWSFLIHFHFLSFTIQCFLCVLKKLFA